MKIITLSICALLLSGCTEKPPYEIISAEYTTWNNDEHYVAKKTILLDNRSGQTWFLSYNKNNTTSDGFTWEPLGDAKKHD